MSLRNFSQDVEYGNSLGMDTTSPLTALAEGFSRLARNANLPAFGPGYVKRDGYSNQLTSVVWTGNSVTAGIEFKTAGGTAEQVVFGTDGSASGGVLGKITSGSVTAIQSSLSGTDRPGLVQFDNLLFFYNGNTTGRAPFIYDGTIAQNRQIGITLPATAPTAVVAGGGSLIAGDYLAAYTYYNAATGAESSPSTLSASTTATLNDKITWTITAGDATTADTIRLYRTVANGNQLFFEKTAAISATSIVSDSADSSLTTQMELDNSRIEDFTTVPKFPMVAQNRVFVTTDELITNPSFQKTNALRFSKIGQAGPKPESFEVKALVETIGKHGSRDAIVGLAQIKDIPLVLKDRSIGRLDPIGIPDNTAVDNVLYLYKEISDNVGAVSHWAGTQVYNEYVFLGRDNVYATNSQTVRPVANQLQATIRAAGFTSSQVEKVSAINDTHNKRVYFSIFSSELSTEPDAVLVGDYQQYPDFRWTVYAEGADSSTHPGIKVGSFYQAEDSSTGNFDVFFGNILDNGKVYKMNTGTNDDTLGISFKVVTRPYSMQQPFLDKLYKDVAIFATGADDSYNLTFCSIYDLSDSEESCANFTLPSLGGDWDTNEWADDDDVIEGIELVWGGSPLGQLEYQPHRKAKFQQLVFLQEGSAAPVTLLGWVSGASVFGRE